MSFTQGLVWLVTGANRGIGLGLVEQLLQTSSNTIIATSRDLTKTSSLRALAANAPGTLHVVQLDVTDPQSIRAAADEARTLLGDSGRGIDYLVNNAGMLIADGPFEFDMEASARLFRANVLGPVCVSQTFLPLVERGNKRTIVNISSSFGSIAATTSGRQPTYAASKSALNMFTCKQAKARPDIVTISMCPGWLQTDLGGQNAPIPVSVGVSGILKVVDSLTPADSGKFFDYKGEIVPW